MASLLNIEWLNQNSQRAYPFREDVQRRPTIDGVKIGIPIPEGLLLDLVLATNFDPQPDVYLKTLTLAGTTATIVLANASDEDDILAVASVAGGADMIPVNFSGSSRHDDIRGTAVFGNLAKVAEVFPDGIYSFEPGETLFEARCCRPSIPCVSGLYLSDPSGLNGSRRLRGDVALVAGANVRLDYDESRNAIIINADNRYAFNDRCTCEDDPREEVMAVNGVSVNDLEIEGVDCVKVERQGNHVLISDTCSKPCCGCAELTFLNQKTNGITTALGKLDDYSRRLDERLNEFIRNVLLSDRNLSEYI